MVSVDMRNSTVGQQYIADVITFGASPGKDEVLSKLDSICASLNEAAERGAIGAQESTAAQANIRQAIAEAKAKSPDKHVVRTLLDSAAEAIKNTVSVANLFDAITKGALLLLPLI
jgi:hypothetical protein